MTERPVALVTGCGKPDGMGQAIARHFAGAGYAVVVSDRDPSGVANAGGIAADTEGWRGVDSVVEQIVADGGIARAVLADISDAEQAKALVRDARDTYGRLDVLVNNAAAPQGDDRVDIEEVALSAWHRQISVNLTGTFHMCQAAVPFMRERRYGRIVNVSSMAGLSASPMSVAYSASKAGIIGLTRALAMDVGPWGITVNAICPGLVGTSRATLNMDPTADRAAMMGQRGRRIPAGRVGTPDDVAELALFLGSPGAGYLTAQAIGLDGGGLSPFPIAFPPQEETA